MICRWRWLWAGRRWCQSNLCYTQNWSILKIIINIAHLNSTRNPFANPLEISKYILPGVRSRPATRQNSTPPTKRGEWHKKDQRPLLAGCNGYQNHLLAALQRDKDEIPSTHRHGGRNANLRQEKFFVQVSWSFLWVLNIFHPGLPSKESFSQPPPSQKEQSSSSRNSWDWTE